MLIFVVVNVWPATAAGTDATGDGGSCRPARRICPRGCKRTGGVAELFARLDEREQAFGTQNRPSVIGSGDVDNGTTLRAFDRSGHDTSPSGLRLWPISLLRFVGPDK